MAPIRIRGGHHGTFQTPRAHALARRRCRQRPDQPPRAAGAGHRARRRDDGGHRGNATGAAAEPLKDEPWSLEFGAITPALQTPSRFEKDVVRTLSNPKNEFRNSHARTPHHLLNGTITPNGLHFSINHCGIPDIDPAQHKLVIHGMVSQPLEFTLETLSRYPLVTRTHFVECAGNSAPMFSNEPLQVTAQALHGLVSNSEWTGVPLSVAARRGRHRSERQVAGRRRRRRAVASTAACRSRRPTTTRSSRSTRTASG